MLKARSKRISLLLVFMMLATLFVGVGTAGAASGFSVTGVPTLAEDQVDKSIGTILVTGYGIDTTKAVYDNTTGLTFVDAGFVVKLPEGFKINKINGQTPAPAQITPLNAKSGDDAEGLAVVASKVDDNSFGVKVIKAGTPASFVKKIEFAVPVTVDTPDSVPAEVKATIIGSPGNCFGGDFVESLVVAKGGSGAVQAVAGDPISIKTTGNTVKISVRATTDTALEKLSFTLPAGFYWTSYRFGPANTGAFTNVTDQPRKVELNATGTPKGIYRFEGNFDVDETRARFGDVTIDLSGSDITPDSLLIGSYNDFGTEVTVAEAPTVLAGRTNVEIADIVIKEKAAASLVDGRSVYLTLPSGARWIKAPISETELKIDAAEASLTNKENVVKFVINGKSANKGTIKIKDAKIALAPDFTGDLEVEVSGNAGVEGKAVVAKVQAPVTVTADTKDVKIGLQSQAGGNIVITEAKAEAIMAERDHNQIVLEAPANCVWAKIPTAKVVEGNIEIDTITKDGRTLTIAVKETSSKASKIELSDVAWTIDRTVPEGDMKVTVKGNALTELYAVPSTASDADKLAYSEFTNRTSVASFVAAKVVTPAPDEVAKTAVFKFGEAKYTLNGVEVAMDVAPYAKNNRTYMPIRYVANALGIADNNVMWDQAAKTVTLIKGDKVVQVKLGSKVMTVNGATINMDVAVEAQNNRTMLPAAWIAQAFGAQAVWNATDNTVTISY